MSPLPPLHIYKFYHYLCTLKYKYVTVQFIYNSIYNISIIRGSIRLEPRRRRHLGSRLMHLEPLLLLSLSSQPTSPLRLVGGRLCRRRGWKGEKTHQRVITTRWWLFMQALWVQRREDPPTSRNDSLVVVCGLTTSFG
jgi:hypothetical protein